MPESFNRVFLWGFSSPDRHTLKLLPSLRLARGPVLMTFILFGTQVLLPLLRRAVHKLSEEGDRREPDLSDDEGLQLEMPSFTGLFLPSVFKSLLFKSTNVASISSTTKRLTPTRSQQSTDPLFTELDKTVDVPSPWLFVDIVK